MASMLSINIASLSQGDENTEENVVHGSTLDEGIVCSHTSASGPCNTSNLAI